MKVERSTFVYHSISISGKEKCPSTARMAYLPFIYFCLLTILKGGVQKTSGTSPPL